MKFLSPIMLWLLLAIPALVALYFYVLRRKKKMALRYANLGMVKEALGAGASLRRHVPAALFLVAITFMLAAIARPAAMITLPSQRSQVILAMDISASMRAADVAPNRMVAAQTAAKMFIQEQPSTTQIGVVAFAGAALWRWRRQSIDGRGAPCAAPDTQSRRPHQGDRSLPAAARHGHRQRNSCLAPNHFPPGEFRESQFRASARIPGLRKLPGPQQ